MVCKRLYEETKKTSRVCVAIFANHTPDKGQVSWICKEISKLNKRKPKIQLENSKRLEETFYQRGYTEDKIITWNDVPHHWPQGISDKNHNEISLHTYWNC